MGAITRDSTGALRLQGSEPARVPAGPRVHQHGRNNHWITSNHGAIRPERLHSTLRRLEQGDCEDWIDLAKYMIRTDTQIRSLVITRQNSVAGSDLEVTPAPFGDPALAEAGADFCREELLRVPNLERIFADLLDAVPCGWAAYEHEWQRIEGVWRSRPAWIHPRDISFSDDYTPRVRDTAGGTWHNANRWFRVDDYPGKFLVHVPRSAADWPQLSGELLALAWQWLFARWIEKFRTGGLERFATPTPVAILPEEAPDDGVEEIREALENLSATHAAVIRGATKLEVVESGHSVGEAWTEALTAIRKDMAVSYVGSDLAVSVGETGGAYALGASQFTTTILPRLRRDARALGETIARDWLGPALRFNSHLFGGRVPPTPMVDFAIVSQQAEPPQLSASLGAATYDEVRAGDGLEPLGPERGGDRLVPVQQAAPSFFSAEPPATPLGGEAAARPFGRTTTRASGPTCSRSAMSEIAKRLQRRSAGPAR